MKHRVGIVGCGNILPAYLKTLRASGVVEIVGLADAERDSTRRAAAEHGLRALSLDELLHGDAELILCLTPPAAHHAIGLRAIEAGKHFYCEKPLAMCFEQAIGLVDAARRKGLRIGAAPDTFFGSAAQTARELIDQGVVGAILYGAAHCMSHGPDHWHPHPERFYRAGAGPQFDMGVYHVTHLVHHLGPMTSVSAHAHLAFRERVIATGPRAGQRLRVEVPTHVVSTLHFEAGPIVELTASFEVWRHALTPIELYGEDGSLLLDDPNCFGGTVRYCHRSEPWQTAGRHKPYSERSALRGLGVIDMLLAIERGEDHRCNERLALHVLEALEAAIDAAASERRVDLLTRCERPPPLPGPLLPSGPLAGGAPAV